MDSLYIDKSAHWEEFDPSQNQISQSAYPKQKYNNKSSHKLAERQSTISWNQQQDYNLIKAVCINKMQSWKKITNYYNSITPRRYHRTEQQCWQRWSRVLQQKEHLSKWKQEEIECLRKAIHEHTINSYDIFMNLIPNKTKAQIQRMVRSIFVEMVQDEVLQQAIDQFQTTK